jgi:hypothetical protein
VRILTTFGQTLKNNASTGPIEHSVVKSHGEYDSICQDVRLKAHNWPGQWKANLDLRWPQGFVNDYLSQALCAALASIISRQDEFWKVFYLNQWYNFYKR